VIRRRFGRRAREDAALADDPLRMPANPREAAVRDALDVARARLVFGAALFSVIFAVIGMRMAYVTLVRDGGEPVMRFAARASGMLTDRAEIVDRRGVVMATSLPVASLFASPKLVMDPEDAARKIVKILPDLKYEEVKEKLEADKTFVWLRRGMTPREQDQINRLGIPGVDFQQEERRIYPQGGLASHVVGYTGIDNIGLAGVEKYFDTQLRAGERVQLSIDLRLQRQVEAELVRAVAKFSAIGAQAVVMDVTNGEILALASLPSYDPNKPKTINNEALFNRATFGVYEQGSVFKIMNTAMGLDSGKMTPQSIYNASEPIRIDRFTINDFHGQNRAMTVSDVFKYSSNIGSAKMALDVGIEGQRAFFERIGMLRAVPVELPESAAPLYPKHWRKINLLTIAFGHGMSVTPLHLAMGTAATINGGILYRPTLVKRSDEQGVDRGDKGVRVVSQRTSQQMREMLRIVVDEGTGRNAAVPGYNVGGKTGTAEKPSKAGYREKALISSFIGVFPMIEPRYLVLVTLDEPKGIKETGGYATGGAVAAPSVKAIIERMVVLYGLPPVKPVPVAAVPGTPPQVANAPKPGAPRAAAASANGERRVATE
jgi:cell division protein FtsI (penicillin-binding protein 3)